MNKLETLHMNKRERNQLLKQYAGLYKRFCFDPLPGSLGCFYCGDLPGERDYCPPLAWIEYKTVTGWKDQGYSLFTVPACGDCNKILGHRALFTFAERAEFVAERLENRFERIKGLWSADEISEMGPEFRRTIVARKRKNDALLLRIRHAQQVAIMTLE